MSKVSFYSPELLGINKPSDKGNVQKNIPQGQVNFKDILKQELAKTSSLKFSAHAQSRLLSRNIALNDADIQKLEGAVAKAEEKGGKESLVLMRDLAFIVNIPNKTVITVTDRQNAKENVFTNIDSTIIV